MTVDSYFCEFLYCALCWQFFSFCLKELVSRRAQSFKKFPQFFGWPSSSSSASIQPLFWGCATSAGVLTSPFIHSSTKSNKAIYQDYVLLLKETFGNWVTQKHKSLIWIFFFFFRDIFRIRKNIKSSQNSQMR